MSQGLLHTVGCIRFIARIIHLLKKHGKQLSLLTFQQKTHPTLVSGKMIGNMCCLLAPDITSPLLKHRLVLFVYFGPVRQECAWFTETWPASVFLMLENKTQPSTQKVGTIAVRLQLISFL